MRLARISFILSAITLFFLSSVSTKVFAQSSLPERLQKTIQDTYDKTTDINKHGAVVTVDVPGQPVWTKAFGTWDDEHPMTTDFAFEVGSVTKTFTAALILQLQEEGKLSIDDSIKKYLPSYSNIDSSITLRQLLNHSSGLYDYSNDDTTSALLDSAYFQDPNKVWTEEELLLNYVKTPKSKPGKTYSYCNTNYVLLGMIAEKVTGTPYSQEVRNRFLTPLGLTNTFCSWSDSITLPFPHNYLGSRDGSPSYDLYSIPKTAQFTQGKFDGGIVSTSEDLAKWSKAIYTGKVLNSNSMKEMLVFHKLQDGDYYGLGVERVPYYTRQFYGHSGAVPGFLTMMYTNPQDSVTFTITLNSQIASKDISINDYALAILDEIYSVPSSVAAHYMNDLQAAFYPNPAFRNTTLQYQLEEPGSVELIVTNLLGQIIYSQVIKEVARGSHTLFLDRNNLPDGIYNYQLHTSTGIAQGHLLFQ